MPMLRGRGRARQSRGDGALRYRPPGGGPRRRRAGTTSSLGQVGRTCSTAPVAVQAVARTGTLLDVKLALRDYMYGVRYAFTRPWRATRDVGLHSFVLASLFGLLCGALGPIAALIDGEPLALLWCLLFFLFGLANAGYVVYRYRRRNEPESEPIERTVAWIATKFGGGDPPDDKTDPAT